MNFPCRTQEISGVRFRVSLFKNGKMIMTTAFENQDRANSYKESLEKVSPGSAVTITEESWKETVCIECGRES